MFIFKHNLATTIGQVLALAIFLYSLALLPQLSESFAAPPNPSAVPTIQEVIGRVPVPPGTESFNQAGSTAGAPNNFALIFFISQVIQVIVVVAGVWVVFNVVWAGFLYLTQSGKSSAAEKVRNLLFMSVLGLLLIVTAYTMAGLVGLLVFGDASYIISPTLTITTP
jgi:hypothetical protein